MVIAFGLSGCSAALIVLSPVAAIDRAIVVMVSFTYFMVSSGTRLHEYTNLARIVVRLKRAETRLAMRTQRPRFCLRYLCYTVGRRTTNTAKSDVSDFARLIAAEVSQGRLRVQHGGPRHDGRLHAPQA